MKVFEIIPADFFSVLVSPNREIYADALMKLYEMFQTEINIRLKSFLAELEILLEDREYILEEGDEAADAEPSSLRGKARLIVRRFVKTGWIDREFLDGSFTEIIIPNSYAITVMRMLSELMEERDIEKELLSAVVGKLRSGYSDARVKAYMDGLFVNGKTEVTSEEISVEDDTAYILTLLSVINAYKGSRGYHIQLLDGYVQKNVYRIPRFVLKRGGKR